MLLLLIFFIRDYPKKYLYWADLSMKKLVLIWYRGNFLIKIYLHQKRMFIFYIFSQFPSVPGGMRREHVTKSHKAEQWAHAAKFTYLLKVIEGISEKFCRYFYI